MKQMTVPFYTSVREYQKYKAEFDQAVQSVMEKGDFILGSAVRELEEGVARYAGVPYALGVANGSDALVLAADALELKSGAEVVTPVFTFFASTSCIVRLGGRPVFCDIDEDTFCMDMNDAASRITKNTRGLLPVHLFSQMADMTTCMKLSKEHNLVVLEDAAEAFGMKQEFNDQWQVAGTIGDAGVYSFFPTKTLGGYGDGGMLVTRREDVYNKVRSLRVHGASKKYHHDFVGYNSRLDTLQAAVLQVKLQRIDEGIAIRKARADLYCELLRDIPQVQLPVIVERNQPVYYVFCVKVENRDGLANYLQEQGIGTSVYYPVPLHLQKCFQYLGHRRGDFPVAEKMCDVVLALPMYPELTEDEVGYTCEQIRKFYRR